MRKQRNNKGGFTLVEIMIVVAIIGLLAATAVPSFVRARMRSQATTILNECRMLDAAMDQYALENNKTGSMIPVFSDLSTYLKTGTKLATNGGSDTLGNSFTISAVSAGVHVSANTKNALSGTTGGDVFWGPYS